MFVSSVLFMALSTGVVAGARVGRRDDAIFVPARVDLDLMFDTAGRYVINVQMGPSRLNLTMTTSSGVTYVAGNQCSQCSSDGVNLYNQSASPTVQQFASTSNVPFFNGTAGASIIKENCSLPEVGGALWPYPNQTIAVMSELSNNVMNQVSGANILGGVSGLVGLGTNRNLTPSTSNTTYNPNFEDSIMGQWLSVNPTALNFTWGVALEKPIITPKPNTSSSLPSIPSSAGTVNWLQPNPAMYDQDTLAYAQVVQNTQTLQGSLATDPQDWVINLNGWVFSADGTTINNAKPVIANVDPLYQGIYIPLDQATLIHADIPGAVSQPQVSTLGSLAQTWKIPCDSQFTMGIVVGSQTYTLDTDTLVLQNGDGTCTSGLEAWTDSGVNQFLLGARFMSAVYIIFSVPRDGSSSIGFANRATTRGKSHTGAIVGGVVGGVIGAIILGLLAWYFFYYRRRHGLTGHMRRGTFDESKPEIVPYPVLPSQTGSDQAHPSTMPSPARSQFSQGHVNSLHSPSMTAFSDGQTITYNPSSTGRPDSDLQLSPSQMVFVNHLGQIVTPATPHSATPLIHHGDESTAPPAYEEPEGSESAGGSSRSERRRPQEKGRPVENSA